MTELDPDEDAADSAHFICKEAATAHERVCEVNPGDRVRPIDNPGRVGIQMCTAAM